MSPFTPNYKNILNAAKNIRPERMPLYEHNISDKFMEKAINVKFSELINGDFNDKKEYMKHFTGFFKEMGYDTVSIERCIGLIMPGAGALGGHQPGIIQTRADFEKYPWKQIPQIYFDKYDKDFQALREVMPEGMKAIGGPGNGVFENVQDLVGYEELCYISVDDPELYQDLFSTVGNMMYEIWSEFMKKYGDIYTVCRFGDDLGFKSQTLIPAAEIRKNILPQYKRIVDLVHSYEKPFLLHSCGKIFDVMDDLIDYVKIDAKHSNEDQIAPFSVWVENYGPRIGNFGGVDVDVLCQNKEQEIKEYVRNVIGYSKGHGGFALGSGNSIPDYVPVNGYLAMIEAARESWGE
jgi:uroporphyrinogen decarboxylase